MYVHSSDSFCHKADFLTFSVLASTVLALSYFSFIAVNSFRRSWIPPRVIFSRRAVNNGLLVVIRNICFSAQRKAIMRCRFLFLCSMEVTGAGINAKYRSTAFYDDYGLFHVLRMVMIAFMMPSSDVLLAMKPFPVMKESCHPFLKL